MKIIIPSAAKGYQWGYTQNAGRTVMPRIFEAENKMAADYLRAVGAAMQADAMIGQAALGQGMGYTPQYGNFIKKYNRMADIARRRQQVVNPEGTVVGFVPGGGNTDPRYYTGQSKNPLGKPYVGWDFNKFPKGTYQFDKIDRQFGIKPIETQNPEGSPYGYGSNLWNNIYYNGSR